MCINFFFKKYKNNEIKNLLKYKIIYFNLKTKNKYFSEKFFIKKFKKEKNHSNLKLKFLFYGIFIF
jgi:hypothetical protein